MAGWLKCPLCGDPYEFDPAFDGPRDEDGCGQSKHFCLACWDQYFALPEIDVDYERAHRFDNPIED